MRAIVSCFHTPRAILKTPIISSPSFLHPPPLIEQLASKSGKLTQLSSSPPFSPNSSKQAYVQKRGSTALGHGIGTSELGRGRREISERKNNHLRNGRFESQFHYLQQNRKTEWVNPAMQSASSLVTVSRI